jgi:hypothetical protein
MGRGRGRIVAAGCVVGALALTAIGCGAQEHANEPRPQPPTRVSVTLTPRAITVQPARVAFGPEPSQQIPQNQHAGQPPVRSKAPLDVVFVAANMTTSDAKLELHGAGDATSGPLVANGNGSFQASLPTGAYTVRAAGIPGAKPVRFTIGPYRSSSQNDVLLP